jgi:hypothetical protein
VARLLPRQRRRRLAGGRCAGGNRAAVGLGRDGAQVVVAAAVVAFGAFVAHRGVFDGRELGLQLERAVKIAAFEHFAQPSFQDFFGFF